MQIKWICTTLYTPQQWTLHPSLDSLATPLTTPTRLQAACMPMRATVKGVSRHAGNSHQYLWQVMSRIWWLGQISVWRVGRETLPTRCWGHGDGPVILPTCIAWCNEQNKHTDILYIYIYLEIHPISYIYIHNKGYTHKGWLLDKFVFSKNSQDKYLHANCAPSRSWLQINSIWKYYKNPMNFTSNFFTEYLLNFTESVVVHFKM